MTPINSRPPTAPIVDPMRLIDPGDLESVMAATVLRDTAASRKEAQQSRDAAWDSRAEALERAADKLREMGSNALVSGLFQATLGMTQAILSGVQASVQRDMGKVEQKLEKSPALDPAKTPAAKVEARNELRGELVDQRATLQAKISDVGGLNQGYAAMAHLDLARLQEHHLQAQKAEAELTAEAEGKRSDAANDRLQEANRLENSVKSLMQRIDEARAGGFAAAVKV